MTAPLLHRILAVASALLAAAAVHFHAADPLWNDEIYTLQSFVFKGLSTVCSDYHVPNNHILPNILHWAWLKAVSVSAIGPLLEKPWLLRLLPLALSALTLAWVFRAGLRLEGKTLAWLGVLFLLSGATFQAYAFQARGYALSMAASAALMAFLLPWARGAALGWRQSLGIALAAAAMLYALPSNAYVWAAALAATGLAQWVKGGDKRSFAYATGGLALGAGLAFLAYLPVLGQMLESEYFASEGALRSAHWAKFGLVMSDFFSLRWLLLPVLLAAAFKAWKEKGPERLPMAFLTAVLVLPFLFSAVRGDSPPERVFLPLLPAFALLLALSSRFFVEKTAAGKQFLVLGGLALYAVLSYAWSIQEVRAFLRKGMEQTGHYYPGLNRNYYQHYYDPLAEYRLFREKHGTGQTLVLESTEEHDLPVYLGHLGQKHVPLDSIRPYLDQHRTFFVSTYYAKPFLREMSKMGPGWRCRYLQPADRLPRVVVCEATGD